MSKLMEMLDDLRGDELNEFYGQRGVSRSGSVQQTFNPVDYGDFKWTKDWYEWDYKAGHKQAMQARNKEAAVYKKKGWKVKKFTLRNQRITRGGIGSGHPQIDEIVTVYGFNADEV